MSSDIIHEQYVYYKRPVILILDSGIGGLCIYTMIQRLLPFIKYLYVLDNKFFPYGERSEKFIIQRVLHIIDHVYKCFKFDLVVVACNTISVIALQVLQSYFKFPIIGVVPNIQLATQHTKKKVIGILSTPLTAHSDYILNFMRKLAPKYQIYLMGNSDLVKLSESNMCEKLILGLELQSILDFWLNLKNFPDVIVLGCTHFSFLKDALIEIFPANVCFIDSGINLVSYIKFLLRKYIDLNGNINNIHFYKKFNKNIAYYTVYNGDIVKLRKVLLSCYNFFSLEMISI